MQKIKLELAKKLCSSRLTGTELALLYTVAHYQNDDGSVLGVNYKEVCQKCGISIQSFYNALKGLTGKGVINITNESRGVFDILIKDNDFNFSVNESYINIGKAMFESPEFCRLPSGARLMGTLLMAYTGANAAKSPQASANGIKQGKYRLDTKKLIESFKEILNVAERTVRKYLNLLQKFFYICVKSRQYVITPKEPYLAKQESDNSRMAAHIILVAGIKARGRKDNGDNSSIIKKYISKIRDTALVSRAFIKAFKETPKGAEGKLKRRFLDELFKEGVVWALN